MDALKQEPELKLPFRILVIAAHHDDIEFGLAGSVALWTDQGAEATFCIVTDGSAGSNDPHVDLAELVERRKDEQRRAAEIVGVKDVRFLGYQDGVLEPTLELRRDLTRLIRELKPHRVVIPDPTVRYFGDFYINHPDHRAAGEAASYAVFSAETRPVFRNCWQKRPRQVSDCRFRRAANVSGHHRLTARWRCCAITQVRRGEEWA
jgi:LmbE family N-acetylglucosaminyl deacetylase